MAAKKKSAKKKTDKKKINKKKVAKKKGIYKKKVTKTKRVESDKLSKVDQMRNNIELAVKNIYSYSDTDIFPHPVENLIFRDKTKEVCDLVQAYHDDFEASLSKNPPVNISCCAPLGYSGFRWATQIDPLWNAYFLSLSIDIAEKIEKVRIPKEKKCVFSYRFKVDSDKGSLFDPEFNWKTFQTESTALADSGDYSHVLICDISDFYLRIYHHKLQNALARLNISNDSGRRIICEKSNSLLKKFSGGASFGLPIGGPAARILAELALNDFDTYLYMNGIRFVRFVDDYHIYGKSQGELHKLLNDLTIQLQLSEKLSIQRQKTQLLTTKEFSRILKKQIGGEVETEKFKFLSLPIHFDPYSDTAVEDYESLKEAIGQFDIIGMLLEELRKQRIHPPYTKKLLKAFIALETEALQNGIKIIADNLVLLFPIIPQAMMTIHTSANKISEEIFDYFIDRLLKLINDESYILTNEINAAYIIKAISNRHSTKSQMFATQIAEMHNQSLLVRTIALRVMGHWNNFSWLSSKRSYFSTMTDWERRSFIMASYSLGDEGVEWRKHNKGSFSDFEVLCREWISESKQKQEADKWRLPV
jgi:hypothetical protein